MATRVLLDGLSFPESPRWFDGRVYVSDWGAGEVHALDPDGTSTVVTTGSAFPLCFDFLLDGRLVLVDGQVVRVRAADGSLQTYAELGHLSAHTFNDTAVDRHGNLYVNNIDFDFPGGDPGPGFVAVVPPDGDARRAADDLMFPNGMAVLGDTLVVAESYAARLTAFDIAPDGTLSGRRTWAELGEGVPPDGLAVDDGDIWYADVPHRSCSLVREGGEVVRTVELDRAAFSCAVGDGVLYVATNAWGDDGPDLAARNGQLVAVDLG